MERVLMYNRFERLWHWSSALLILLLLFTGFEIHGTYTLLGFEMAVDVHIISAWTLIGLWILAIFWHMVTGEWKQYVPSSANKLIAMMKYYGIDIFMGGGHPHHKTRKEKLNPMQRLAYLALHVVILPFSVLSGLLYYFYPYWGSIGLGGLSLVSIALIHTALAFAMLAFLIMHLYLALTTSEEPLGYMKAMMHGYENE
ncbi:MAG TPA: cytochrome B [Gammaproteobacteria bacterium]|nr:cytochrome B [Gammaproteobacteria bacterium]